MVEKYACSYTYILRTYTATVVVEKSLVAHYSNALSSLSRELVFADSRTLISRHSADRELEQAVRFLHDNGTLLHYEDPLLADFYFVDPQWLCDMLAHIITVREINPFIREGETLTLFTHSLSARCLTHTSHFYTERVWFYTHVGLGYEPLHQGG